jgi:xanthine/uracil permease
MDQDILHSQVLGFVVFVISYATLSGVIGLHSILVGLILGWLSICTWKIVAFKNVLDEKVMV